MAWREAAAAAKGVSNISEEKWLSGEGASENIGWWPRGESGENR